MWMKRQILILSLAGLTLTSLPAAAFPYETLDVAEPLLAASPLDSLHIVINVPARRLVLARGERYVDSWPIAVGRRHTPTPVGHYQILQKARHPTWAPKGGPVVPPGPKNPLGSRWMRISEDGYGIHATNDPASIGLARSKGCIRMHQSDVEELFELVAVGTRVEIVYELHGWDDVEGAVTYPDLYALDAQTHP